MACYVDPILNHGGSATFRWQRSCHLFADTDEELHEMAERLGLRRAWFQHARPEFHHYDLTEPRRMRALAAGALAVSRWEMVAIVRERRRKLNLSKGEEEKSCS